MLESNHSIIFVAEADGRIVGFIAGFGGKQNRIKHRIMVVIGILQAYSGQQIGARLFTELENWAISHDIHRMELTVMSHNERAISLYNKMGFEMEGTRKHSLFVDGKYVDEYYLYKFLQ